MGCSRQLSVHQYWTSLEGHPLSLNVGGLIHVSRSIFSKTWLESSDRHFTFEIEADLNNQTFRYTAIWPHQQFGAIGNLRDFLFPASGRTFLTPRAGGRAAARARCGRRR